MSHYEFLTADPRCTDYLPTVLAADNVLGFTQEGCKKLQVDSEQQRAKTKPVPDVIMLGTRPGGYA